MTNEQIVKMGLMEEIRNRQLSHRLGWTCTIEEQVKNIMEHDKIDEGTAIDRLYEVFERNDLT